MQPMALYPVAVTFLGVAYFGAKLMIDLASDALFPWCDHPVSCYDFRTELSQSVDPTVDVCEGLYDHTCGFWALNHPLSGHQIAHANQKVYVEILKLLSEPPKRSSSSVFDKTVTAFSECQAVADQEQEHLNVLLDVLKNYSLDWPPQTLSKEFNVLEALVGLSMDLGMSVIFGFELSIDFKTDKRYGFVLTFSNINHNSSDLRLQNVIQDCIGRLKPMPRMSSRDLAERIASMNTEMRSLTSSFKLQKKFSPRRVTIEDVGNATSPIFSASDWTNAINKRLPQDRQINSDEEIVTFQEELLPFLKEVMRGKNEYTTDLMIYVGWAIIRTLSSGLSSGQVDCAATILSPPGQGCVQMVGRILPFPLGRLLFDAISPPGVVNLTSKIMNDILEATKQSFEMSWMDNETVIRAKDRVDSITTVVSLPAHLSQRKDLEAAFDYVPSFREPFIRSYLETVRKLSEKQKRLLVHDPAVIVRRDDLLLPMTEVNAYYLPLWHMMVIPGTILLPPFVHPSFPAAVNYGAIGKVLGHELSHSFDFYLGQISKTGDDVDWYTKDSREKFRQKMECVIDQVENASDIEGIGRSSIAESFADTAGVEKAYSAYSKTVRGQGLLSYTPDQLFFLSGCFAFCAMQREAVDPEHKYPPTFLRCDVPASNEEHFAEVFKCRKRARLNPKNRCDFH